MDVARADHDLNNQQLLSDWKNFSMLAHLPLRQDTHSLGLPPVLSSMVLISSPPVYEVLDTGSDALIYRISPFTFQIHFRAYTVKPELGGCGSC